MPFAPPLEPVTISSMVACMSGMQVCILTKSTLHLSMARFSAHMRMIVDQVECEFTAEDLSEV